MDEISAQEANIVILMITIQILEKQDFSSPEISEKDQTELRKAKHRQLEVLRSNLIFAEKLVKPAGRR